MPLLRPLLVASALILAAAIVWAGSSANIRASFGLITADPWGIVTLIDLYAGFVFAGAVIWLLEPRKGLASALILLTLVLGNLVTLLWLALRGLQLLAGRA